MRIVFSLTIISFSLILGTKLWAQATFDASGLYTQDFGTAAISSWSNNSVTFPGWYLSSPTLEGANVTSAAGSNNGGSYSYLCGVNNRLIGTRPSNAFGGTGCTFSAGCGLNIGLRLQNNSGSTIQGLRITYDGYQLSTAQDGSNTNLLNVYYQTGATVTSVTAGSWTAVPSLDYTGPNTNATCGGNQVSSSMCSVTANRTHCLSVSIPIGEEIMIRWWDRNNACNDPHLAIDNISVEAFSNTLCNTLPVTLLDFNATNQGTYNHLTWTTTKEINNAGFVIERSLDGTSFETLGFVDGYGNGQGPFQYAYTDFTFANQAIYYRLVQKDDDGTLTYYPVRYVSGEKEGHAFSVYPNPSTDYLYLEGLSKTEDYFSLQLINQQGNLMKAEGIWENDSFRISTDNLSAGHYLLQLTTIEEVLQFPIIIGE